MLWVRDFQWPAGQADFRRALRDGPSQRVDGWVSSDGSYARVFQESAEAPGDDWVALEPISALPGASAGQPIVCLCMVETDVLPEHEADFNAWYAQEHLPGLAAVPGTIRAARYRRRHGAPRYLACYHLTSPATMERPQWLAVRGTEWSSRVRPTFQNPRRTMFVRDQPDSR